MEWNPTEISSLKVEEARSRLCNILAEKKPEVSIQGYLSRCESLIFDELQVKTLGELRQTLIEKRFDRVSVCGRIWKTKSTAYRCRTCEANVMMEQQGPKYEAIDTKFLNSAICTECFDPHKHEGHDFYMITVTGGCCDCGDPQAWGRSGFCNTHQGIDCDRDPTEAFPQRTGNMLKAISWALMNEIKRMMDPACKPETLSLVDAMEILKFLTDLCSCGDGIRRLISLSFVDVPGIRQEEILLSSLFRIDESIPSLGKEVLYDLYLSLLVDPSFKEIFLRHLLPIYGGIVQRISLPDKDLPPIDEENNLLVLCVQFFSVSNLIARVSKDIPVAAVVLESVKSIMRKALATRAESSSGGVERLDFSSNIIQQSKYAMALRDFRTIISHDEANVGLLQDHFHVYEEWVSLLSMCQKSWLNNFIPKGQPHVDQENENWIYAFYCNLEFLYCIPLLMRTLHRKEITLGNRQTLIEKMVQVTMRALSFDLGSLLPSIQWEYVKGYPVIIPTTSPCQFSFHLPLHRNLAALLYEAVRFGVDDFHEIIRKFAPSTLSIEHIHVLLSYDLLNLQACWAQSVIGIWKRNGCAVWGQAITYSSMHAGKHFFDHDIFLLQVLATLINRDHFVELCKRHFSAARYFEDENVKKSDVAYVDNMFRFFICLVTDGRKAGWTEKDILRNEVLHRLFVEDLTHSKLTDGLATDVVAAKRLNEVIKDVAVFSVPNTFEQGKFSVKPELWCEFNPFYPWYSVIDRQKAESRFETMFKGKPRPNIPTTLNFHKAFRALPTLLYSGLLQGMIYKVLKNAVSASQKHTVNHGLLSSALHLLELSHLYLHLEPAALELVPLEVSSSLYQLSTLPDYVELKSEVSRCLDAVMRRPDIKDHIDTLSGANKRPKISSSEDRKRLALERKESILASFAAKQTNFAQSFEDFEDSDEDPDEPTVSHKKERPTHVCVMCHEGTKSSGEKPMGLIAFIQRSNVPSISLGLSSRLQVEAENQAKAPQVAGNITSGAHIGEADSDGELPRPLTYMLSLLYGEDESLPIPANFIDDSDQEDEDEDDQSSVEDVPIETGQDNQATSPQSPDVVVMASNAQRNYILSRINQLVADQARQSSNGSAAEERVASATEDVPADQQRSDVQASAVSNMMSRISNVLSRMIPTAAHDGAHNSHGATANFTPEIEIQMEEGDFSSDSDDENIEEIYLDEHDLETDDEEFGDEDDEDQQADDDAEGFRQPHVPTGSLVDEIRKTIRFRKYRPKKKPPRNPLEEYTRNLNNSIGIHISYCGHQIHEECYQSYFDSLLKSHLNEEEYEGFNIASIPRLEFVCPACRRLSNTLIPIIPERLEQLVVQPEAGEMMNEEDDVVSLSHDVIRNREEIMSAIKNPCDNPEVSSHLRNSLDNLITRIYCNEERVGHEKVWETASVLQYEWSAIGTCIANGEIAARDSEYLESAFVSQKLIADLWRNLIYGTLVRGKFINFADYHLARIRIMDYIHTHLDPSAVTQLPSSLPTILQQDAWSMLVQKTLSLKTTVELPSCIYVASHMTILFFS
eukprot:TRINITY_DN5146_c0_g1_i2.p1 TRINITY_DN5146_c0_g1~~TRINITY_DN5146_c0_g1_i2.p1  ORF type:complete len:1542 (+),score=325.40 TRINITY_DN5146_c0_g1_i2:93-4718(+)